MDYPKKKSKITQKAIAIESGLSEMSVNRYYNGVEVKEETESLILSAKLRLEKKLAEKKKSKQSKKAA